MRIFTLSSARLAMMLTLAMAVAVGLATLTPLPKAVAVGGSDKLHHVLAFAALALPVAALVPTAWPRMALTLALYGGLIELIQPFVGRSCELADWVADLVGILVGGAVGGLIYLVLIRRSRLADAPKEIEGA